MYAFAPDLSVQPMATVDVVNQDSEHDRTKAQMQLKTTAATNSIGLIHPPVCSSSDKIIWQMIGDKDLSCLCRNSISDASHLTRT